MNRRNFLQLISLEAAVLMFAQKLQAQDWGHDNWDGFFVTLIMDGAWDISLSTDPWLDAQRPDEKEFFIEYRPDELVPWGTGALGPAMAPMKAHLNDISIINGVFMSTNDNGHESLQNYAMTGDPLNQRGALGLEINATLPNSLFNVITNAPIPTGERANRTTEVYSAESSIQGGGESLPDTSIEKAHSGILSKVREAQKDKAKLVSAKENLVKFKSLLNNSSDTNSAAVVAASFKAGLSRTAILNFQNLNLDTHSNHAGQHLSSQTKGWEFVSETFRLFKAIEYKDGKSLFDATTFLITSEFSRTPALNTAKGKDHNPWTNSALLAGRGIKGGITQGASHLVKKDLSQIGIPYMTGLNFDFTKNTVVKNRSELSQTSSPVLPQNVLRTAVDAMGLNLNVLGGGLHKSAPFKNLLKG